MDGTDITGATIDGQDVQEITVDGQTVFTAGPPASVIEFFENGDISGYGGDNGFDLINDPSQTVFGDFLLQSNNNINNKHIGDTAVSTQQGERYEWRVKTDDDLNNQFFFIGLQNENGVSGATGYGLNFSGGNIRIVKVSNGGFNSLASTNNVYSSTSTFFRPEVTWGTDDSILFELFDDNKNFLGSVSTTDSSFTSGGIGFQDRSDGGVSWDYVQEL